MKSIVLDSYAILALLFEEPGADAVEEMFASAVSADQPVLISSVNWAEVLYISLRKRGAKGLAKANEFAIAMPLDIVPPDAACAEAAAELKAACHMSLADAFAAALAKLRKADLVTGDPEFRPPHGDVHVRWLPMKKGSG